MELRGTLGRASRIVVKVGTAIVTDSTGRPSLSRLGAIVEQICWLRSQGKEVIFVSSGAVGIGRQVISKLANDSPLAKEVREGYNPVAAGVGQLGLISLYEKLFNIWDIPISLLLLTEFDFREPEHCKYVSENLNKMLRLGIVPILNENDAISGNKGYNIGLGAFSDNDGLASLVASHLKADLLILLTDVEKVYTLPPTNPKARGIEHFKTIQEISFGEKSSRGRGGIEAKIRASLQALAGGVGAVVIASGIKPLTIEEIIQGKNVGTLFMNHPLYQSPSPSSRL